MKPVKHSGRAANCACKGMPGARCPDCNHVLTGKAEMIQGGELGGVESQVVKCTLCGRVVTSQQIADAVVLEVQNLEATQQGVL